VIPLEHVTLVPAVRLCEVIGEWGGTSGEKVIDEVNPPFDQMPLAWFVSTPTRFGTLQ
jgi:hypothetical protein